MKEEEEGDKKKKRTKRKSKKWKARSGVGYLVSKLVL